MREEPRQPKPPPVVPGDRKTIVKRPRGSVWNHLYLDHEVDISGFLLKQSTHRRVRQVWQRRFFQFRGPYLIYWNHKPNRTTELADSVVDLREISNVSISLDGTELVLMSVKEHGFRLKSCLEAGTHAAVTDLSNWKRAMIERVEQFHNKPEEDMGGSSEEVGATVEAFIARLEAFYSVKAPELLAQAPRIAARFEGREQLLFQHLVRKYGALSPRASNGSFEGGASGNINDDEGRTTSEATATISNPILNGEDAPGGGIEMLTPPNDVESPIEEHGGNLSVEIEDTEQGGGIEIAAELPRNFQAALTIIGVRYWDPLNFTVFEYLYLKIARGFFFISALALIASGPSMAIALPINADDEGKDFRLTAPTVCGESLKYKCVTTFILYLPLSFFGMGLFMVLRFLYGECQGSELIIRTHRKRVSGEIDRAAIWTPALWVVTSGIHIAGTLKNDFGVTSVDQGYFNGHENSFYVVKNLILCLCQLPLFIFAIIFHGR